MNYVFALVGKSGTGKTALSKRVSKELNIPMHISCTTREPRQGEVDGIDYYFLTIDGFANQETLERVQFAGNWYGTLKKDFECILQTNPVSVIVVEKKGLKKLKSLYGKQVVAILLEMEGKTRFDVLAKRDGFEQARKRWGSDLALSFTDDLIDYTVQEDGTNWDEVFDDIVAIIKGKIG